MGSGMQNDTQNDTEMDQGQEVSNEEAVNTDEGKSIEEINAEIEQELEGCVDGSEVAGVETEEAPLDPQAQLEADLLKWKDTAMRNAADLENFRKRMSREKAEAIKFGNQRLIEELLPVIDSFSMGMMAAEAEADSMIYMGMQMVQTQIENFLSGQGVTEAVTEVGSEFDPNIHDAMSQEESDTFEEGKIIRVMRKGYKLGDRLIRPANVVVSKNAEPEVEASKEEVAEEANKESSEA